MNDRPDLERLVTDWLHAGSPARAPDRVLATALDRVGDLGQEWPFGGRRFDAWIGRAPRLHWAMVGLLIAVALLGTLAIAGAMLRQSPMPAPAVTEGWVAYTQRSPRGDPERRNGPVDIYLVRQGVPPTFVAGTRETFVKATCPAFSPDGSRLAYAEATGPNGGAPEGWEARAVVIVGVDSSGISAGPVVRIPASEGGQACPVWSPDGRSVAFLAGDPDLMVAPADGSAAPTVLIDARMGELWAFTWAPDGTAVAMTGPNGVWVVPTDGSEPRRVDASAFFTRLGWSPDGSGIAVVDDSTDPTRIRLLHLDGAIDDIGFGSGPVWSPDGRRIAYTRAGPDGRPTGIVVADPDGANEHVILLSSVGSPAINVSSVRAWSPDGDRLLVVWPGGQLISISATGDPAPVVLVTSLPSINDDVSWQSVRP